MEELKKLIFIARDLYISIPVSEELLKSMDIPLEPENHPFTPPIKMQPPPLKLADRIPFKRDYEGISPTLRDFKISDVSSIVEPPLPPPLKRIKEGNERH